MNKNIVYLVHGGRKFYDQARMSLLTLLDFLFKQRRHDYRIVVYCDDPQSLPQHPFIHFIRIPPEQLKSWRGPLEHVHRIKLEILRNAAARLIDPFIYVDCDTRWLRLPDVEFEALVPDSSAGKPVFFMHMNDGELSPTFYPHYFHHLTTYASLELAPWGIRPRPWLMWNSGVVGVSPKNAGSFFDEALAVCDLLLPYLRPRLFTEQCAISLLAQSRFEVRPFDHCLHHYWNFSSEAPIYLESIFTGLSATMSIEQQAAFCGLLVWDESQLRKLQSMPINRLRRRVAKLKNSFYQRRIDLRAARLRLAN